MSESQKRKRPESGLTDDSDRILNVIKSKGEDAIAVKKLKQETKLPTTVFNKCIKNLKDLLLIKEITDAQFKEKHYIAAEFNPTNKVTGGVWYVDGKLDTVFINQLKELCLRIIKRLEVATDEGVYDFFKKNNLMNAECTSYQISEILKMLVLDNEIIEVKSAGLEEYQSIPVGKVCYRCPVEKISKGLKQVLWLQFLVAFANGLKSVRLMELFHRVLVFTTQNGCSR